MANKGFGDYIREARKDRGWTQEELAERLRVSPTTVSNWERLNRPDPDKEQVNDLVAALGLSAEQLLTMMGYRLTPPAAARLPRQLVLALLTLRADELALLQRLARGLAASQEPGDDR